MTQPEVPRESTPFFGIGRGWRILARPPFQARDLTDSSCDLRQGTGVPSSPPGHGVSGLYFFGLTCGERAC